jgi:anti-anti-sigma factor
MNISEQRVDDVTQIRLDGRFDAHTADSVETFLRDKISEGCRKFVMDMEHVSFIDSAGLRVILVMARDLRNQHRGEMHMAALQPAVRRVFEISGLENVISLFEDSQTATQRFTE